MKTFNEVWVSLAIVAMLAAFVAPPEKHVEMILGSIAFFGLCWIAVIIDKVSDK